MCVPVQENDVPEASKCSSSTGTLTIKCCVKFVLASEKNIPGDLMKIRLNTAATNLKHESFNLNENYLHF